MDHPYPVTKIMWTPDLSTGGKDLLATTGDYLRIWNLDESGASMEKLLNNVLFFFIICKYLHNNK